MLLLVFCYLNTAELCAASRVSRRWYTVSRYPLLWRTITISETVIPPQVSLPPLGSDLSFSVEPPLLTHMHTRIHVRTHTHTHTHCTHTQVLSNMANWCSHTEKITLHGEGGCDSSSIVQAFYPFPPSSLPSPSSSSLLFAQKD